MAVCDRIRQRGRRRWRLLACALSLFAFSCPLPAQVVLEDDEQLASERPEAWAMGYLHAATQFHALGDAGAGNDSRFDLAVELAHIPRLSESERRVGLNGIKLEDLNKTPLFGRLRLGLALPAAFRLELGWTPPLRINGARADSHYALALQRSLIEREHWRLGARFYALRGTVSGDITCPDAVAAFPVGSADNPFGCRASSEDRFHARSHGVEVLASWSAGKAWRPYVSAGYASHRYRTQVDAFVYQVHDRSRLHASNDTWSLAGGLHRTLGGRWSLAAELRWTPLDIRRPGNAAVGDHDAVNLRLLLRRHWR